MNNLLPVFEVWAWKPGYEGRYEISNRGRVRSWVKRGSGINRFRSTPHILSMHRNKFGYYSTHIGSSKLNDDSSIRIHRDVAIIFCPNPGNKAEVNHLNGKKYNNEWFNLEWATRLENIGHAFKTGLIIPAVGEEQSNTKLKNEEVLFIFNSSLPTKELSKMFCVGEDTIGSIKIGRTWGHITGKSRNPKVEKITNDFILEIFNYNGSAKEAASFFNRSYSLCNNIKSGIKYSNVTGKTFVRKNKEEVVISDELILGIYNSKLSTKECSDFFSASKSFIRKIKNGTSHNNVTKHIK